MATQTWYDRENIPIRVEIYEEDGETPRTLDANWKCWFAIKSALTTAAVDPTDTSAVIFREVSPTLPYTDGVFDLPLDALLTDVQNLQEGTYHWGAKVWDGQAGASSFRRTIEQGTFVIKKAVINKLS